jgi:hypothetical protein
VLVASKLVVFYHCLSCGQGKLSCMKLAASFFCQNDGHESLLCKENRSGWMYQPNLDHDLVSGPAFGPHEVLREPFLAFRF